MTLIPQTNNWSGTIFGSFLQQTGSSNAVPSILPKTGWAIAHPALPPLTPLCSMAVFTLETGQNQQLSLQSSECRKKTNKYLLTRIYL